jgi:hypothetical protein
VPLTLTGEHAVQCVVMARLRAAGVLAIHVPNEGKVTKAQAQRRQREGVTAGVPDILIFDPPPLLPGYAGAGLELKDKGRPSVKQLEFLRQLHARRWVVDVAIGEAQALAVLRRWGYL